MFVSCPYGIYQTFDFHNISKVNTKSYFPSSSRCLKYCDEILSIQLCLILFVKCFLPLQETQKLCIGNQTNHCNFGCNQSWSGKQPTGLKKRNKIDPNLLITDHRQYVLVEVNFCFLRVPLRWLMAAKHKASDYQSWCATERCTNSVSNKGVIIQRMLNNVFNLCAFGVMTGH